MKVAIVYWSGTGNTEMMAKAIADGATDAGADVSVFTSAEFSADMAADFDRLAFGCPAMGAEELEETEFEPMFESVEPKLRGKEIALFGSYGWGDGEWMEEWKNRCENRGATIIGGQGLILNETPDDEGLQQCKELGRQLGA